jgi:hypothetical protein
LIQKNFKQFLKKIIKIYHTSAFNAQSAPTYGF